MSKDREPEPTPPPINRPLSAAITLESYYVGPHSQIDIDKEIETAELNNEEAVEWLHNLARHIMIRKIKTHREIAIALRFLGPKLTEDGGVTEEINLACLEVEKAIIHHNGKLKSPKPLKKSPADINDLLI